MESKEGWSVRWKAKGGRLKVEAGGRRICVLTLVIVPEMPFPAYIRVILVYY